MVNEGVKTRNKSSRGKALLWHEKDRMIAFEWIYKFGYSTEEILDLLVGRKNKKFAATLEKEGWLVKTRTSSDQPKYIYTLTSSARRIVSQSLENKLAYKEINADKVRHRLTRHNLIAQSFTVKALVGKFIKGFATERMMTNLGRTGKQKRPDVVWVDNSHQLIAVEVELNGKYDITLDKSILSMLESLDESPNKFKVNRYLFLSPIDKEKNILIRYKDAMQPGRSLRIWGADFNGNQTVISTIRIPDWLITKVSFRCFDDR